MQENIKRVLIWSGWLRLSHWLLAAGVIFQIFSAWAIGQQLPDHLFWHDWHLMSGHLLILVLLFRLLLFFTRGSNNWKALIPTRADFYGMQQMLKFYISFGRAAMPNWYAHNPLWKPVYLFWFLILALCLLTGLLQDSPYQIAGMRIQSIHSLSATVVTIIAFIHVASVFLHDLKGKGGLISAMISGYRYFHIEPASLHQKGTDNPDVATYIPVDDIKHGRAKQQDNKPD